MTLFDADLMLARPCGAVAPRVIFEGDLSAVTHDQTVQPRQRSRRRAGWGQIVLRGAVKDDNRAHTYDRGRDDLHRIIVAALSAEGETLAARSAMR